MTEFDYLVVGGGTAGLRVADASVFPTIPSVNPGDHRHAHRRTGGQPDPPGPLITVRCCSRPPSPAA
jgi:hypothetical protein